MKVKMCLAKIATSLLSILEIVLATVVLVCAVEQKLPPLNAFLLVLSWSFWLCGVLLLPFGLIFSEYTVIVYGYSVFCVSPSP